MSVLAPGFFRSFGIAYVPSAAWSVTAGFEPTWKVRTLGAVWMTPEITWLDDVTIFPVLSVNLYLIVSPTFMPSGPGMRGLISFIQLCPSASVPFDGITFGRPSLSGSHEEKIHSSIVASYAVSEGQLAGGCAEFSGFRAMTFDPQKSA